MLLRQARAHSFRTCPGLGVWCNTSTNSGGEGVVFDRQFRAVVLQGRGEGLRAQEGVHAGDEQGYSQHAQGFNHAYLAGIAQVHCQEGINGK